MTKEPSSTTPTGAATLPLAVDSFLGREADLARIEEFFEHGRLVTITGAPGMGKTRLATEMARASVERYQNGVWVVALAPLTDPKLVAPALATALGVPEQAHADILAGLAAYLGSHDLLLVLDNCEHLLDACAQLAGILVESCPNLRILAISQERLGVPGEQVWPLSGLAVPNEASGEIDEAAAAAFPAVALFAERARAISPGFTVDATHVAPVIEICRRLDGIPLAIELAAARVETFSPAEIAARLDDRFALLTAGARTARPRHQTLRAAVDWSYELLTDEEQAVLRRLAVFAGGATLDAIERVCAGPPVGDGGCAGPVTRLVARSLVVVDNTTTGHAFGGVHGGAKPPRVSRYRLLETIRLYGHDRLVEAGEASTTAARHLDWCIEFAEEAERHLTGPGQVTWSDRLATDHDNLRAALARSLDQGPTDQGLRLAGALALFWRVRGHFGDGLTWLRRSVAVSETASGPLRAKVLWGYALVAAMAGEWVGSLRSAQASVELYRRLGDGSGVARALLVCGTYPRAGDTSANIEDLQQAIAMARQAKDKWCLAYALAVCGTTFHHSGDRIAGRMLEEAVAVASEVGEPQCLHYARISLALVLVADGELRGAQEILDEIVSDRPGPNPYERAAVHMMLAGIAMSRGDTANANRLLDLASQDHDRSLSAGSQIEGLCLEGKLNVAEGNLDAAQVSFSRAHDVGRSLNLRVMKAVLGMGEIALAQGDHARAQRLFDEVREGSESTDDRRLHAGALHGLACVALATGDDGRAADQAQRAVALWVEVGDRMGLADSLEIRACADVRRGRVAQAIRMFAAVNADRSAGGYVPGPLLAAEREAGLAASRESVGTDAFADYWTQGSATSLQDAAAASRARRGRRRSDRPASGPDSLTDSELAVARLVLDGLSNPEVVARLFLSPSTVKTHLGRVYAKLGVSSRRELREQFKGQGL